MRQLYAVVGWGFVALGAVHMIVAFRTFHTLNGSAIWFFNGGITLVLEGALNLLHRSYGLIAPGLRRVCIGTNVLMTVFGVVSGIAMQATITGFILVLGLTGGATALALSRRALCQRVEFKAS